MNLKGVFLLHTVILKVSAITYIRSRLKLPEQSQTETSKIFEHTEESDNQEELENANEFVNAYELRKANKLENVNEFEYENEFDNTNEFEDAVQFRNTYVQEFQNANEFLIALKTNESKIPDIASSKGPNVSHSQKSRLGMKGELFRKFFIETFSIHQQSNVLCSPMAAYFPLGKLMLATRDETSGTFKELARVLGLQRIGDVRKKYKPIIEKLSSIRGVALDIATRIYVTERKKIKPYYANLLFSIFNSGVESADFVTHPVRTANIINNWVLNNTHGKVEHMIVPHEMSKTDEIVIVHGVYFSGIWKHHFRQTSMNLFRTPHGLYRVAMMTNKQQVVHGHCDELDFQMLEIMYKDEDVSMLIIQPNQDGGLPTLIDNLKLDPDTLQSCSSKMTLKEMRVTIPRFSITSDMDLSEIYESIGLTKIFDPETSGLNNMINPQGNETERMTVSKILFKAVVEVNETGFIEETEPEYLTESEEIYNMVPEFNVSRPFMFIIKANKRQILVGVVRDLRSRKKESSKEIKDITKFY